MRRNESYLLKLTAVAACITAVTTFLLWLLPRLYDAASTFEGGLALQHNPFYMARLWVNLLHIPFALAAYFGLAYHLRHRELGKVGLGMVWFVIWGAVEMTGVATIIFSVNGTWRAAYAAATDSAKLVLQSNIEAFYSVWDSMFFVLLIAFLLGTILYGWATWRGSGLEKTLSYMFWLAAPLTVLIMISGYAGAGWADAIIAWTYPVLQPVSRFVLGLVLWKNSSEGQ